MLVCRCCKRGCTSDLVEPESDANSPWNAFNGNGLNTSNFTHKADAQWDGYWVGPMGAFDGYQSPSGQWTADFLAAQFAAPTPIKEVWMWNYNSSVDTERGLKQAVIKYTSDGSNWVTAYDYRTNGSLPDGIPVNNTDGGFLAVDLGGASVLAIEFDWVGAFTPNGGPYPGWPPTWGDGNVAGMSEIAFHQIPEPATLSLLGLGIAALMRRK
jgi:hypothetical protein